MCLCVCVCVCFWGVVVNERVREREEGAARGVGFTKVPMSHVHLKKFICFMSLIPPRSNLRSVPKCLLSSSRSSSYDSRQDRTLWWALCGVLRCCISI